MAIDAATVRKVAHLARIKTPDDRLEPLAAELNGILAWLPEFVPLRSLVRSHPQ